MRVNTRFPVSIHILTLAALIGEERSTSENIAKSVNTNPVVIRRINAMLKKAGLITVISGVGGTRLNRRPEDITLLDIYHAVISVSNESLFDLHHDPNPSCPVGANIQAALAGPLASAQLAMEDCLSKYTLADIVALIPTRTDHAEGHKNIMG